MACCDELIADSREVLISLMGIKNNPLSKGYFRELRALDIVRTSILEIDEFELACIQNYWNAFCCEGVKVVV